MCISLIWGYFIDCFGVLFFNSYLITFLFIGNFIFICFFVKVVGVILTVYQQLLKHNPYYF